MQIFEFELIDQTVTAPEAAQAPILASARAPRREHLLEQEGPALAGPLNLAVPSHPFVSGSGAAEATSRHSERCGL
jgi:hypothetical protein